MPGTQVATDDDAPLGERDLLEEMVMALVDHPSQVRVEELVDRGRRRLLIHTDPRDRGQVIGKSGRTVDAIRTFLNVVASKGGSHVTIDLADQEHRPARGTSHARQPRSY